MTHTEVWEALESRVDAALENIKQAKNGDKLSFKKTIAYYDDNLKEFHEFNKSATSIIADIEVRIPGKDDEEDPFYSIGLFANLKHAKLDKPEDLAKEYEEFDNDVAAFISELSNCEDAEAYITQISEKQEKENEEILHNLENQLNRLTKTVKIATFVLIAIVVVTLVVKLVT